MFNEIKRGILFTAVTSILIGGAYNGVLWAIGQAVFTSQSEGSLIRRGDGTIVGSRLIAQKFTRPEYFHPRPSGVDYNAASTGGTNYGPSNPDHLKAVRERLDGITKQEGATPSQVPSEMVTASGGGRHYSVLEAKGPSPQSVMALPKSVRARLATSPGNTWARMAAIG